MGLILLAVGTIVPATLFGYFSTSPWAIPLRRAAASLDLLTIGQTPSGTWSVHAHFDAETGKLRNANHLSSHDSAQ